MNFRKLEKRKFSLISGIIKRYRDQEKEMTDLKSKNS
jgi:hypothetical protein